MIFRTVKALILWSYARNTWQYDVLCVLILAFIFLTPKSWFETGELGQGQSHQSRFAATRLLVGPEIISPEMEIGEIERRVRHITGRPDTEVTDVRKRQDAQGKIVAYEVDIR
jgi:uncharacterized membrane protein YfhO